MRNATYTTRIKTQHQDHGEMGYGWLNIYHANHSVENKIVNNTNKIQLIKKDLISKKNHQSVWASYALLFILILAFAVLYWNKKDWSTQLFVQTLIGSVMKYKES